MQIINHRRRTKLFQILLSTWTRVDLDSRLRLGKPPRCCGRRTHQLPPKTRGDRAPPLRVFDKLPGVRIDLGC